MVFGFTVGVGYLVSRVQYPQIADRIGKGDEMSCSARNEASEGASVMGIT
jgi:hypothetical protein